jgi:predicted alpha-1,2-mannosidase
VIVRLIWLLTWSEPIRILLIPMEMYIRLGSYTAVIHEMREMQEIGMGQYAHNNEPLHHVLYLYNYAGQPWKTQKWVRKVMAALYSPEPDGLCGDDDTGQLSAWYVFSALGFYPVCPGQPIYVIGSPLFRKSVIRLAGGREFMIEAIDNSEKNVYIQSITLNGKRHDRSWLTHSDIVRGGELVFKMGPAPNRSGHAGPNTAPPRLSQISIFNICHSFPMSGKHP